MQWFISAYATLLERHRRVVVACLFVASAVLIFNIFRLKSDLQIVGAAKTSSTAESDDERILVERAESSCVVILSGDEVFSPKGISIIRTLDKQLTAIDGVADVKSLFDMHVVQRFGRRSVFLMLLPPADASPERIAKAKERAIHHPLAAGHLITKDGRVTTLGVAIDRSLTQIEDIEVVVNQIHEIVDAAIEDTSFEAQFTGMPEIRVQTSEVVAKDQVIFNIVGALAGMAVNFLMLRRAAAVAIVSAGSWLGVAWTFGVFGLLGQPLTPINGIVAPLAMTIGLTDSIHLMLDIRRFRATGLSRVDATISAVRDVGLACTLTSLTTVVGFLSLGVADLAVLRNLGYCCAVAVGSAYFTVLTVVPLLSMTWLGDHIAVPVSKNSGATRLTVRLAEMVTAHRWTVFIGGVVATLLLAACSTRLHSDTRLSYALPEDARKALVFSDENFDGTIPIIIHIEWTKDTKITGTKIIGALEDTRRTLAKSKNMSSSMSLLNVLQMFPVASEKGPVAALRELKYWPRQAKSQRDLAIDFKKRSMFVYLRSKDAGSHEISKDLEIFAQARRELTEKYPGFSFRILQSTATSAPVSNQIVSDLMMSMMLAVPVTLGIVAYSLGSLYFAAVGLLPNVFPMVALSASLVLLGQPLLLVGAVVFTFSFGVAVDDTIHVLSNFQRMFDDEPDVAGVIAAVYKKVGGALVASTLILLAGMGVVVLSRTLLVRAFGAMFCVTLAFALIADLLILPATLACFPPKRTKTKAKTPQPTTQDDL